MSQEFNSVGRNVAGLMDFNIPCLQNCHWISCRWSKEIFFSKLSLKSFILAFHIDGTTNKCIKNMMLLGHLIIHLQKYRCKHAHYLNYTKKRSLVKREECINTSHLFMIRDISTSSAENF